MSEDLNRRPIKARSWKLIEQSARWLSRQNISPNQISIFSIVFAALAGGAFILFGAGMIAMGVMVVLVLIGVLGRALCNLWDGMVAVEGGKQTKSGELFNDVPDRIADALIFIGAGYAAGFPELGFLAALLAVMTAYVRGMVRAVGAPSDFQGPMAKATRMAIISLGAIGAYAEAIIAGSNYALPMSLIIISVGCVITIGRRLKTGYNYLEGKN